VSQPILVRGARTHNLADVTVEIPRGKLVAICGPSGAGKSSLAFDTIYGEAQRRYLEALGNVPGVSRLPRADVDAVIGLPAAVAVGQRGIGRSARSTLGTSTEVLDVVRVLYARLASARCPVCSRPLVADTPQQIVDAILARPAGTKLTVLAPIVRQQKGDLGPVLARLAQDGFVRARLDGALVELGAPPTVDPRKVHELEAVVDRIVVKEGVRARLADSVELGLRLGEGRLRILYEPSEVASFAARLVCAHDDGSLPTPTPALFSANHPDGACATCGGLGTLAPKSEADEREDSEPGLRDEPREPCPSCKGTRLSLPARCFDLGGVALDALLAMPLPGLIAHLDGVLAGLQGQLRPAVAPLFDLARSRLVALAAVGLGHLSLGRTTDTLSAGERMRARLATQIGAGLTGVLYVLDEPSIGQSPGEVAQMLGLLRDLLARGNDVLVVDHDLSLLRAADHVIDVGPAAGRQGGHVVAEGPPSTLSGVTGPWLRGEVELPAVKLVAGKGAFAVKKVRAANLRDVDVEVPKGALTAIVGPSGAGKSALLEAFARAHPAVAVRVDDTPLGRTARASAATALGILPRLRELFAQLPEAKTRGYKASRFSLHAKGGRCEACLGEGTTRVELVLLPDTRVPCPVCRGARYDRETLEVRYRGASMADVLSMAVDDAQRLFESFPKIRGPLDALRSVGLGYLALGQPSPTLSGGEAQRVKLARGLALGKSGKDTLWLLDEPTVGLHPSDVARLLEALVALRDQGDTVVLAEHDPALIARCDFVVELGPGAGAAGGTVVGARRRL